MFSTIDLILNEKDPITIREIADLFREPLKIQYSINRLSNFISSYAKDLGVKYNIKEIHFYDAFKLTYDIKDKFIMENFSNDLRLKQTSKFLFKSQNNLIEHIKKSTSLEKILVVCYKP